MWREEYSLEIDTTKEIIWSLWADVRNWNKWNIGVEYSNLNGNFKNGTYGSVKTSNWSKALFLSFELKNCIENKSFIKRIKLPLCVIDFGHELIDEDQKLTLKHYIKIYGPLAFYYKKKIGYYAARCLPLSVKKLVNLVRKTGSADTPKDQDKSKAD